MGTGTLTSLACLAVPVVLVLLLWVRPLVTGRWRQRYDESYRAAHRREPQRWFPLHDRCGASYDLVPAWVNPALVVLSVLSLGCLGVAGWLVVRRR
jgi:hypothetical protein